MAQITYYFHTGASAAVTVDVDDPTDEEQWEAGLDEAWNQLPMSLCASCSGWGSETGVDLGGDWDIDGARNEDTGQFLNEFGKPER